MPAKKPLSPELAEAFRNAGFDPALLPPLSDPVPVSHASGPAEYQDEIDAAIARQWREWRQRNLDVDPRKT